MSVVTSLSHGDGESPTLFESLPIHHIRESKRMTKEQQLEAWDLMRRSSCVQIDRIQIVTDNAGTFDELYHYITKELQTGTFGFFPLDGGMSPYQYLTFPESSHYKFDYHQHIDKNPLVIATEIGCGYFKNVKMRYVSYRIGYKHHPEFTEATITFCTSIADEFCGCVLIELDKNPENLYPMSDELRRNFITQRLSPEFRYKINEDQFTHFEVHLHEVDH